MGAETTESDCLTVWEANSLRSRSLPCWFLVGLRRSHSRALSFPHVWPTSPCASSLHFLSMHIFVQVLRFYKNASHIGLSPTLMTSFNYYMYKANFQIRSLYQSAQAAIAKDKARWLKPQTLFSYSCEGWKSEMRVSACLGSGKWSLPSLQTVSFLLCPYMTERGQKSSHLVSLLRALMLSESCPHDLFKLHFLKRPHLQMPSQWWQGFCI